MQTIGEGISTGAETIERAQSLAERTKAENQLESKLADIQNRASQDPDVTPEKHKKYQDELDQARNEAASGISLPYNRSLFNYSAEHRTKVAKITVDNAFTKRTIDSAKAELTNFMDNQKNKYISTDNPLLRQNAILERDHKIDEMVNSGFMARNDAEKAKLAANKQWNEDKMAFDVNRDPYTAAEELKKGEEGFYRGLDAKLREEYRVKAETRVNYLDKRKQEEGAHDLMVAAITGNLTPAMVEEKKLTNTITDRMYGALVRKVKSSALGPTDKKNGPAYMAVVNTLLNPDTKPEDARVALLEAQAAGKISEADFKKIYQMHLIPTPRNGERASLTDLFGQKQQAHDFDAVVEKDTERTEAVKEKNSFLKSAVDYLQSFTGNNHDKASEMTNKLYDKALTENNKPEEYHGIASQMLSKELLKAHPEIKSVPKTGVIWTDAHNNKIRVFPDGTFQEEAKK